MRRGRDPKFRRDEQTDDLERHLGVGPAGKIRDRTDIDVGPALGT